MQGGGLKWEQGAESPEPLHFNHCARGNIMNSISRRSVSEMLSGTDASVSANDESLHTVSPALTHTGPTKLV